MAATSFELESTENDQAKLVVRMSFATDRFETQLELVTAETVVPLLRSIEGTAQQQWPSNGPLQEVVPQSTDDGKFLAGVGRGGKSHWSTIIAPTKDASGIEFDFACRAKTAPDWLGSTYQFLIETNTSEKNSDQIIIPCHGQVLVCTTMEHTQAELGDDAQLSFTAVSSDVTLPRTVRWKYRFELSSQLDRSG